MEIPPAALSGFNFDNSLMTPLRSIVISGIVGHVGFKLSGVLPETNIVQTQLPQLNWR